MSAASGDENDIFPNTKRFSQYVLPTLLVCFAFSGFVSCKKSQNVTFATTYMKNIQIFMSTAIMDSKLYASFFLILLDETTSQL